ncbi:MAG TPA: FAD-binding and (Fe-S)-binding domain-containing protein, partial [Marmoricola sp.]|nr:FAD-binding and (Fe-S)-binding domain-containing protein [Marmoricola sp.]
MTRAPAVGTATDATTDAATDATTGATTAATLGAVVDQLRARVDGEVRFDAGSRAAYSTDASNFRQVPLGVVVPRTIEAAVETVAICHEAGLPIVSRGGGTSLAGQGTNAAVVLDFSKYCHRLLSVDPDARTCVVEPGIVLDDLNRQLEPTGLRFGPEPATHPNCTLGGMIGNNSCGATAQRTGKTVDNIASLEVLLHDGTRFTCGPTTDEEYAAIAAAGDRRAEIYRSLLALRDEHLALIRTRYPDIPRRVSGYNLDSLLPEHGFDVGGLLVGSESTLVTVLRAELKLVPRVKERTLVVLGFSDIFRAGDAVPAVVEHGPIALEGVDRYLVRDEQIKGMNSQGLEELPEGTGFLMVQFGGETQEEADQHAQAMLAALGESEHDPQVVFYDDPAREDELWEVREAGLAATAHLPHRRDTFEGWEDSAVPPERLGDYLRDLRKLFAEYGYAEETGPALYGHFGQGCVHTRIPFDLYSAEGVENYRRFLQSAAELVVSYGGSLSGEHGDGQTRGELLPKMFGTEVVRLFEQVKALFDPDDLMNPGKVVRPAPLDADLRLGPDWAPRQPQPLQFAFPHDGGSFREAANRCVGVGKCRKLVNDGGTVMCPSYQVTREEKHSTRGRARLLFEMLDGHGDGPIRDGWRSTEVREALDLCLACKGCKSDCPANVDMATYKAEFLYHHYRHRLRPRADYALGWLPVLARLVE